MNFNVTKLFLGQISNSRGVYTHHIARLVESAELPQYILIFLILLTDIHKGTLLCMKVDNSHAIIISQNAAGISFLQLFPIF